MRRTGFLEWEAANALTLRLLACFDNTSRSSCHQVRIIRLAHHQISNVFSSQLLRVTLRHFLSSTALYNLSGCLEPPWSLGTFLLTFAVQSQPEYYASDSFPRSGQRNHFFDRTLAAPAKEDYQSSHTLFIPNQLFEHDKNST